jgi:hypothetical protein
VVYNWDSGAAAIRAAEQSVVLARADKHQYFVVAPLFQNGVAVLGDVSKFVSMADARIASVEPNASGVRVGVIANSANSPIITGYSVQLPASVSLDGNVLARVSSLERLKRAQSGWFWDYQTKLWRVKADFSASTAYMTKTFEIRTE